MVISRERLMKLLIEKPKIPFSEFEEIVTMAINSLDDTYAVRVAKEKIFDKAISAVEHRVSFFSNNIGDLKKILPPEGPIRINILGKIGELVEIRDELLTLIKTMHQMKHEELETPVLAEAV